MNKYMERIYNGVVKENPSLILMLGMCPTLAVTTSASNGLGMGLSTMAVLIFSNLIISLMRKVIPDEVRLPAYMVIVASLVTVVDLLIQAYIPALYSALGIYIPLIVVNCIILGRAEAYAAKHEPLLSTLDGLGLGLGFTIALVIIGFIRELLGAGTIFGNVLLGIFIGTALVTFLYIFLIAKANRTYTAIENQTSVFVSLLCNHAKGSSDIVKVMRRTLPNLSDPLYTHVKNFLVNADLYGSTDVAFDIMKESIDNKRLKIIITNLKTCSHYEANYEDVLQQMVSQITAELSSREERKTILLNGKVTVAALTVITAVILFLIAKMLDIPIKMIMFETFIGQVLSLLMGLLYLHVIVQLFAADKN